MGRLSQCLERRALQTAIPGEREAPSLPKGQGSGQSTKPGAGEGRVGGGWERPPGAPEHRCWTSASLTSCSVPVRDPVCLGTWAFCLYLETREKEKTSVQFSSVAQSCLTLCDPMNHSTPGLPVHYQLPEFTQTHIHRVSYAIQPSHPLSSPSPPAPNPSQHQSLFQ